MSRQISFFHSEHDAIRFMQEIGKNNGMILVGSLAVPAISIENIMLSKMNTHSCKFSIISSKHSTVCRKNIINSMMLEFSNCCKGNGLSRTYEVGRIYLAPTRDGNYVPEAAELYESLRKYIKENYRFEKKAGAYFAPEFWEKYDAHYYYATRAGKPVSI